MKIVNGNEVKADFIKYSKKVNKKNDSTINKFSQLIMGTMIHILRNKVINWTGGLANSIKIEYIKNGATITPDKPYANYIEHGGGKFSGYKYVKGAVDKHKNKYITEIKNNLKV